MIGLITASYLVAGVFFILSLKGLSSQESAKMGNAYGIIGMIIAIFATLYSMDFSNFIYMDYLAYIIAIGSFIGLMLALRVKMTAMPELIALLHSFVGLSATLIGFVSYLSDNNYENMTQSNIHHIEIVLGVFIGAVTFAGSLIAYGKLKEVLSSRALTLPLKHFINIALVLASIYLASMFMDSQVQDGQMLLLYIAIIAFVFGLHLVLSIGGADMPVVISMLNSYSGWAASATGFMLANDLLIITGALVGSSGAILSYIMCKAMNRSFLSVILGGFGTKSSSNAQGEDGEYTEINANGVAELLQNSKTIMVTPGYGMATAQAQHVIKQLMEALVKKNIKFTFAIHPVAGRMPGHMNVLLAEAKIPYDLVFEMDEVNDDIDEIDTVLVIGANDTVNPSALDDENSPIAGMPVIKVWEAKNVVVFKRGMATGYAGVQNPLFFKENTQMIFGDAKKSLEDIVSCIN